MEAVRYSCAGSEISMASICLQRRNGAEEEQTAAQSKRRGAVYAMCQSFAKEPSESCEAEEHYSRLRV